MVEMKKQTNDAKQIKLQNEIDRQRMNEDDVQIILIVFRVMLIMLLIECD